jgi:hypothetical protein
MNKKTIQSLSTVNVFSTLYKNLQALPILTSIQTEVSCYLPTSSLACPVPILSNEEEFTPFVHEGLILAS